MKCKLVGSVVYGQVVQCLAGSSEARFGSEMTGKGKRPGTQEDLKALVPLEKLIDKKLLLDKWKDLHGNKDKGSAFLSALVADEQLFEWRIKRSGTNDAKMIARKPQTKE
jgi:hypothetical protein